ncbi:hypothetical protein [Pseudomonas carassii]|uniref:Uncharacterized protein n=1 Tax=Pseudomonas carassii TaxID=3115855 RepID=A0ABU7HEX5_9PSED|nr:hypothetical protein [Pseudomonas sp. 137P]MEE1889523.1 hypothetical protein [Pseudomonas sp. 137P]
MNDWLAPEGMPLLGERSLNGRGNGYLAGFGLDQRLTQIRNRLACIVLDYLGNLFNINVTHFTPLR